MNFLTKDEVLAIHDAVLELHGGEAGFLNEAMLESALAAVPNRHGYEHAGLAECAATYAFHLTNAHAFVDGNKRVGLASAVAFLRLNGAELAASSDELHDVILAIADGSVSRDDADAWFASRVRESRGDAGAP
jgi:death-on-curing protein